MISSPKSSCCLSSSRPKGFSFQSKPSPNLINISKEACFSSCSKRNSRSSTVTIKSSTQFASFPIQQKDPKKPRKITEEKFDIFTKKIYERAALFLDQEGLDIVCPTSQPQSKTSTVLKPCLIPTKLKSLGMIGSRASTNDGGSLGDLDILEKAVPKFLLKRALSFLTETPNESCTTLCEIKQESCFPVSLVLEQQSLVEVDSVNHN